MPGSTSHAGRLAVNHVALLDFPNVIGPNGSNSDRETSLFTGLCEAQNNLSTILQPQQ